MSIIVHGPQGTGKTLHAPRIAEHFGCDKIMDVDDLDVYRVASRNQAIFKGETVLYLTTQAPPPELEGTRRIVSIADCITQLGLGLLPGMKLISLEYEVRYYLASTARDVQEITVSTLMYGLGYVHSQQSAEQRHEVMQTLHALGWTRRRAAAQPRPWVYQRPAACGVQPPELQATGA